MTLEIVTKCADVVDGKTGTKCHDQLVDIVDGKSKTVTKCHDQLIDVIDRKIIIVCI